MCRTRRNPLDPVETLDVRVPLVLELCPVELVYHLAGHLLVAEAVRSGLADVVGNIGGVPHDLCKVSFAPSRLSAGVAHSSARNCR